MMKHTPYTRFIGWFPGHRWGAWFTRRIYAPLDRWLYRKTGGRRGLSPQRMMLWLTTTGAKTHLPRGTPVLYLRDPGRFWVVASNYGGQRHPSWSVNLLKHPDATVRIGREVHQVKARLASDDEKAELWSRLVQLYPAWRNYTSWTDRPFRLFELEVKS